MLFQFISVNCKYAVYGVVEIEVVIKSWRHKGLRLFFETGKIAGIQAKHVKRLKIQLALLDAATKPEDLNLPGFRFHSLKGERKGDYSIVVNGNWRITFQFEGTDAILLNYEDYH